MGAYKVQIMGLQKNANDYEKYEKFLKQYSDRVDGIRNRLYLSSSSSWSIKNSLRTIADGIDDEARVGKNMSSQIEKIARKYEEAENKICGNSKAAWSEIATEEVGGTSGTTTEEDSWNILDLIWKPLAAAVGPLAKLLWEGWKNRGSGVNWLELFTKGVPIENPLKEALGKYFDFSTMKKGLSSACKWVMAGVTSFISNLTEHGNFGERFWGETVTETLIKVGENILLTAGVGAVLALLPVSAPVWATAAVVAGVTVLVDWGLDAIVKSQGSKVGWVECLSDFINDGIESIQQRTRDRMNGIHSGVPGGINGFNTV